MCYHRSYIVTENCKVLSHPTSDHHTDIRQEHRIREDGLYSSTMCAAVEYRPRGNLFDPKTWELVIDEQRKVEWFGKDHREAALEKLISDFKYRASGDSTVYKSPGELLIPFVNSFKPGTTLIADMVHIAPGGLVQELTILARDIIFDDVNFADARGCRFICERFRTHHSRRSRSMEHYLRQSNQLIETGARNHGPLPTDYSYGAMMYRPSHYNPFPIQP